MVESRPRTIGDIARLVRAKNAGPFWLTLDVFLNNDKDFREVCDSGAITDASIADLYQTRVDAVHIFSLPELHVIKVSFPCPTTQGAFADRDMHSGQQSLPLAGLPLS